MIKIDKRSIGLPRGTQLKVIVSFVLSVVLSALVACSDVPKAEAPTAKQRMPTHYALSTDGNEIAFNAGKSGIGIYQWRTGQLRYLPLPAGFVSLGWPSYSADGTKLAVIAELPRKNPEEAVPESRIGIIDLVTEKMTSFAVSQRVIFNPVFSPSGKAILYLEAYRATQRPFILSLGSRISKPLLPDGDGFYEIVTPAFANDDTIFFSGMGPKRQRLKDTIKELGANSISTATPYARVSSVTSFLPYSLRIGSEPQIALMDFVKQQITDRYSELPDLMPASRDLKRIAFTGFSKIDSSRRAKLPPNLPRRDLFVIENDQVRQITHLENYLGFPTISQDGSTAAFGIYPGAVSEVPHLSRGTVPLELAVVDLRTGEVTRTDFVRRIHEGRGR